MSMKTQEIDALRQRAQRSFDSGHISREQLSKIQGRCSHADTADLELKPALRDRKLYDAVSLLDLWESQSRKTV